MAEIQDKILIFVGQYQRGTYHMGLKIYNSLSAYIKDIAHNNKEFKLLKKIFFIPNLSIH
jgi:hypothetical protein